MLKQLAFISLISVAYSTEAAGVSIKSSVDLQLGSPIGLNFSNIAVGAPSGGEDRCANKGTVQIAAGRTTNAATAVTGSSLHTRSNLNIEAIDICSGKAVSAPQSVRGTVVPPSLSTK